MKLQLLKSDQGNISLWYKTSRQLDIYEYLELIIIQLELNQNIKIGEGDSSLALGMTWRCLLFNGKAEAIR
jgi:hypothetical protein